MRRAGAVALVVLAVGGSGFAAVKFVGGSKAEGPAPQTLKKAVWGLTEHNGESLFPKYRDLGIGIFETQARWDWIAPRRPRKPADWRDPAYEWPQYLDQAVRQAERHGMEVTIQIIG